eukprot:6185510-Pleurochrysis_carterae.AAC.3
MTGVILTRNLLMQRAEVEECYEGVQLQQSLCIACWTYTRALQINPPLLVPSKPEVLAVRRGLAVVCARTP